MTRSNPSRRSPGPSGPAESVWAFDVGRAAFKALKVRAGVTPGLLEAEAFDHIEYPHILGLPGAEPEDFVRQAVTTFRGRHQLKGSRVVVGVPGRGLMMKCIKLPHVKPERIPDFVKFESLQSLPFALDQVAWDYQVIGYDSDEEVAEVGMFFVKLDDVRRAIRPLMAAGIEVDLVQPAPIALFNLLAFDSPKGAADDGLVVLLDVGVDDTQLVITDGHRPWGRNVPIGGNHFTHALTQGLNTRTWAAAEHLKRNFTESHDPDGVFIAMHRVLDAFSLEVKRSIGFYSGAHRTAKIARVIGLGYGFRLPGFREYLQQELGYKVETLETFERLECKDVTVAPLFHENVSSFGVCYGLALQGLSRAALRTNLLPPEWRAIRGWSPGAAMTRVRRLFQKTRSSWDDVAAPAVPERRPPTEPPEPPECPACRAEWPSPKLDACPSCEWQRYPGADRQQWGRAGRCPRCGFAYRWDGARCFHCHLGTAEPSGQESSGPTGGV